eukprot:GHVP01014199.1.p1 GENE.GHVP01014199.1~~GHVP01014199.1.p1  ORF type:complete len:245 (+),score=22.96 GHVP01014199.1:54-737(+)
MYNDQRSDILSTLCSSHVHLALCGVLFSTTFFALEKCLGPKAFFWTIPQECRTKLKEKMNIEKDFEKTIHINSMAFLHSAFVVLIACGLLLFTKFPKDPVNEAHPLAIFNFLVMIGYFTWDICRCWKYRNIFGIPFLVHAVLSYLGLLLLLGSPHKFLGLMTFFTLCEISTPFLHIRFLLISVKETKRLEIIAFASKSLLFFDACAPALLIKIKLQNKKFSVSISNL